jgi:hypothetical protein
MLQLQFVSPMRRAYWVNFLDVDSSQTHPRGDCGAAVVDSVWRTPDISGVDVDTRETQRERHRIGGKARQILVGVLF